MNKERGNENEDRIIGLGIMGKPMSKNLLKAGHELVVCDFNKDAVAEVVAAGAKEGANGAEIAKECDVIITMLPNSPTFVPLL